MEPLADWRERAACRRVKTEMVPKPSRVKTAKRLCAQCPVRIKCLLEAEEVTRTLGPEFAQGVWGGLTVAERNTMAGMGRLPDNCSSCGLECVPINMATSQCSACDPTAKVCYDDYRMIIELMVKDGKSYREISEELRLNKSAVVSACGRWKLKIGKRSASRTRTEVMECGTLAAKYRHHRKEKYSWRNCPQCKFVPWNKGAMKTTAKAAA